MQTCAFRLDAQFELVRRNAHKGELYDVAFDMKQPQLARIHAMWGIGQRVAAKSLDLSVTGRNLQAALKSCSDPDPEIRAQAVKLVGVLNESVGGRKLRGVISLLDDPNLRVRYFAAAASGRCKDPDAISPLLKLAAANHPVDPYIRHAIVMGLVGAGDVDALAATVKNSSPDVRIVAVVALRRLRSPLVARFINDPDERVATEAARAIHDDWSIPEALPALAEAAGRKGISDEAFIRRALNANLRIGGIEQINRLIRYATDESRPSAMRVEALDILANWETPAVNDRVEGWYRTWPQRSGMNAESALNSEVAGLLASHDHDVSLAATQLIDRLGIKTDDTVFVRWVADDSRPAASRVTALRLLASRKYPELSKSVEIALSSSEPLLRIEALRLLADQEPARALKIISEKSETGILIEKQAAFRLLGELRSTESNAELSSWLDKMPTGEVPAEVQLDLIEAAESTRNKDLRKKLRSVGSNPSCKR